MFRSLIIYLVITFLQMIIISNAFARKSGGDCFHCNSTFLNQLNQLNQQTQSAVLFYSKDKMKKIKVSEKSKLDEILEQLEIQRNAQKNQAESKLNCLEKPIYSPQVIKVQTKSDKRLYLRGDNFKYKCDFTKIIYSALKDDGKISEALDHTNFDPCCLPKLSLKHLGTQENTINGFSIGLGMINDQL